MEQVHRRPLTWVVLLVIGLVASLGLTGPAGAVAPTARANAARPTASTPTATDLAAVTVVGTGQRPSDPVLARRVSQVAPYVHAAAGHATLDPAINGDRRIDAATRSWAAQRVTAYPRLYRLVHASPAARASPQVRTCFVELDIYWWGGVFFIADQCAAKRIAAALGSAAALAATLGQFGVPAWLIGPFTAYFAIYGIIFNTEAETCPNGVAGWILGPIAVPYCA